jgi:hypothetical protein
VKVEGRSRGLIKPHTFFEVDDERVDRVAVGAPGLTVSGALLRLRTVTFQFLIFPNIRESIGKIILSFLLLRFNICTVAGGGLLLTESTYFIKV